MSVLIKGMEMPTEGGEIRIFADGSVWVNAWPTRGYMRIENASAIPVPPHGRLIEKETILDKCYQHYEDYMFGKVDGKTALLNIEKEIKTAPTIIEAEEVDDERVD